MCPFCNINVFFMHASFFEVNYFSPWVCADKAGLGAADLYSCSRSISSIYRATKNLLEYVVLKQHMQYIAAASTHRCMYVCMYALIGICLSLIHI